MHNFITTLENLKHCTVYNILWLVHSWFLKIAFVYKVNMCVHVCTHVYACMHVHACVHYCG